ncbi:MAG TPA: hypothetical protein DCX53_10700 [Anaerolineae bacterium]|nr:hypothetical protein [Anaerolineae bacterium]
MTNLPLSAQFYIIIVTISTTAFCLELPDWSSENSWFLTALIVLTIVTQLSQKDGLIPNVSYNASIFGYSLAFFALGRPEAVWVALLSHLALLFRRSKTIPWFVLTFNIGSVVVPLVLASLAVESIFGNNPQGIYSALEIIIAGITFIVFNHLMIGIIHLLTEGSSIKDSGMFERVLVIVDATLFSLGAATAIIWNYSPYAVFLTIGPLYLLQLTLQVPNLEKQKNIEPKTGLFNARYFNQELDRELARANRHDRPLTVVVADLDYLRNINNTYGHLAGDIVIVGVAKILKDAVREYDIVARFGGEEFTILMPETTPVQALSRIEDIRKTIEAADFDATTHQSSLKITMSFGIAGRNSNNNTATEILHLADVAVYQAKQNGRNQVFISEE